MQTLVQIRVILTVKEIWVQKDPMAVGAERKLTDSHLESMVMQDE